MKNIVALFLVLNNIPLAFGGLDFDDSESQVLYKVKSLDKALTKISVEVGIFKEADQIKKAVCQDPSNKEHRKRLVLLEERLRYPLKYNLRIVNSYQSILKADVYEKHTASGLSFAQVKEKVKQVSEFHEKKEKVAKDARFCIFQQEIKDEIANISGGDRKVLLEKVSGIANFIAPSMQASALSEVREKSAGIFGSIFSFFQKKPKLTVEDCTVLAKTFEIWSSFYDLDNNDEGEKIPFYNVNPHNASYFYWMKERNKGQIPTGGLPLIHFDTHTDMGHVHVYNRRYPDYSRVPFTHVSKLLYSLTEKGKEGLSSYVDSIKEMTAEEKKKFKKSFANKSKEVIVRELEEVIRESVHQIAQPLVGAAASDVTSDLIMVLPPWSPRLNRSKMITGKGGEIEAEKQRIMLIERRGALGFAYDQKKDVLDLKGTSTAPIRPNNRLDTTILKDMTLSVTDANPEKVDDKGQIVDSGKKLEPLANHLKSKKFILDIDLDGFVSNGRSRSDRVEPISFARSKDHRTSYGSHGGHGASNETDPNVQVSALELDLIKDRVDSFMNRLQEAKNDGHEPAVITISDSTTLLRAIEGQKNDSKTGGNYTPQCLVFLLNYMVRSRLNEIYNLNIPK